jgi:hypothetical protein
VSALGVCIINSLMLQGKFGKGDSTFWKKSACVEVCGLLRGDLYFICTLCVFIKCYFVLNEHPSWSWESASKVLLFIALALNDSTTLSQLFYLQFSVTIAATSVEKCTYFLVIH